MRRVLPLLFVLLACREEKPAPLPDVAEPLLRLRRPMLAGGTFDPASVAGKVAVVHFWSPHCKVCGREAPDLQAAANALRDRGVELVTVMSDGTPAAARAFASRNGLTAPVILGDLELLRELNVLVYPWTLIVDRSGRPVRVLRGARSQDELREAFQKAL